jgi:hypothetical protein
MEIDREIELPPPQLPREREIVANAPEGLRAVARR